MIDFELYRVFIEVAKEENITKASEKLNISQPAVTKQIKNLENQLSLVLFERKSKGLILTEDGKKLYEKLKNPIEELNKIDKQIGKEKIINIGTHNHMGSCVFGKVINEYCLKYPEVNLNLICEETSKMLEKLENKEIDIVFSKKIGIPVSKNIKYILPKIIFWLFFDNLYRSIKTVEVWQEAGPLLLTFSESFLSANTYH